MDPSFTFEGDAFAGLDDGPDSSEPAWELRGAIDGARENSGGAASASTTADDKISRRLREKSDANVNGYIPGVSDAKPKPAKETKLKRKGRGAKEAGEADGDGVKDLKRGGKPAVGDRSSAGDPSSFFSEVPDDTKFEVASFAELNLSRVLVKACTKLSYEQPTPIQASCIPLVMNGRDMCASAVTGSGKTAAYGLPLLERLVHRPRRVLATYVLILVPTRELAVQVHSMLQKLAQFTDIRCALVVGGLSMQQQAASLRSRPEVVVATPNRMIDHLKNTQSVGLEDLSTLVLDEGDRLLDMGFSDQIKEVVSHCPRRRQTLLFSATMTEEVQELVALSLRDPVRVAADPKHATPTQLAQEVILLKGSLARTKDAILLSVCTRLFHEKTVVFAQTKQYAHKLKLILGLAGLKAAELHGNMSQAQRLEALESFRRGESKFLVATDVASRGLDILGVETVISFDPPSSITTHVHRIGRTARAGRKGKAVTLLDPNDRAMLKLMAKHSGGALKQRVVSSASVASAAERVEAMEADIAQILHEEREERFLRRAEMEATRATNMVECADEIASRPAKEWYQSGREKKHLRDAAREAFELSKGGGNAKARKAAARELARKEKAAVQKKRDLKVKGSDKGYDAAVKASKSRERKMREGGLAPHQIRSLMESAQGGQRTGKKRKADEEAKGSQGKKPNGWKAESEYKPKMNQARKMELNRRKRGGSSVKAFKSIKKYKRR